MHYIYVTQFGQAACVMTHMSTSVPQCKKINANVVILDIAITAPADGGLSLNNKG
jgi:hypothetical protein